jgi:hypothetical protein
MDGHVEFIRKGTEFPLQEDYSPIANLGFPWKNAMGQWQAAFLHADPTVLE